MQSQLCNEIITEIGNNSQALFKFISANDLGITGSHQCGFYLPINVWKMYTPYPPRKGVNFKNFVLVKWQNGLTTDSCITWYGKGTRREYRLTRFGRNFPWLSHEKCGDLLILIFKSIQEINAYVLSQDEEIEYILDFFGIEIFKTWGIYNKGVIDDQKDEKFCIKNDFKIFVNKTGIFPSSMEISNFTWETLRKCISDFDQISYDERIMTLLEEEYILFKMIEEKMHMSDIVRKFKSIDEFLKIANSILQRRKARAGRSVENQFEMILKESKIVHVMRPHIEGEPDVVIPSVDAYNDKNYPLEKLFIIGIKRTCKDRWRQVLNEATRVPKKYIFTIQPSISKKQLDTMKRANVTLIVPSYFHKNYPPSSMDIYTLTDFLSYVQNQLG